MYLDPKRTPAVDRSHEGNTEHLMTYWTTGEGGIKLAWNTPGDFTRCVATLGKYVPGDKVKGLCANLHHRATGRWPASDKK